MVNSSNHMYKNHRSVAFGIFGIVQVVLSVVASEKAGARDVCPSGQKLYVSEPLTKPSSISLLLGRVLEQADPLPSQILPRTEVIRQEFPDGSVRQSLLLPIIDDIERRPNEGDPPPNPRFLPKSHPIGRDD